MELFGCGKHIESIFGLLGKQENDVTKTLSYIFSKCKGFTELFIKECLHTVNQLSFDDVLISFQDRHEEGITDIELCDVGLFKIVIEAKINFNLPGVEQLTKYANYLSNCHHKNKVIVVLSEVSKEIAIKKIASSINNVPIKYVSYGDVKRMINTSLTSSVNKEKELLRQYLTYLSEVLNMIDKHSNTVYVVPINGDSIKQHDIERVYTCLVGKGFLKKPVNYLGFRFDGKLKYINHVDSVEYFEDKDSNPSFKFKLGPDIIPNKTVRTGGKLQGTKFYCDLDLLLTCDTIVEACKQTKERHNL